jgi:hypothetical protein
MSDPSAIGPLIDALVTIHTYKVVTSNPGGMSAMFSPDGSAGPGGLSVGGGGPKYFKRRHQNQQVLDALSALTRQNFSFDQVAWRAWNASQQGRAGRDLRQD